MQLRTLNTGLFKLDGGAMFGVVPKPLWHKLNPADAQNRCTWAMRCLLAEEGNRLLLVDTGLGNKQDAKFFSHYVPEGEGLDNATLLGSLRQAGHAPEDVTDVMLTHLHFDHVGGAVQREGEKLITTFPNATYWVHSRHWNWAVEPNPREKASFLKENILPLHDSGQLKFLDQQPIGLPGVEMTYVDGHTEKMVIPRFKVNGQTVVFAADLIPSAAHVLLPYIMSYDVRPLLTMNEKQWLLERAVEENWVIVFEHDPAIEAARVVPTERGIRIQEQGNLADLL